MTVALVLVVSTRAQQGIYKDATGSVLMQWLENQHSFICEYQLISDQECFTVLPEHMSSGRYALIITTGGTGLSPDDCTPQITRNYCDYEIPGIAERIRAYGREHTPYADISRGICAVKNATLIINLAGSLSAVNDGIAALDPILDHALIQLGGQGHLPPVIGEQ